VRTQKFSSSMLWYTIKGSVFLLFSYRLQKQLFQKCKSRIKNKQKMKSKGRTISYMKEIAWYSISLHVTYMVPTLEQRHKKECGMKGLQFHTFSYSWQISSDKRHKRVWCERIAISYIFIFMTDFKWRKAQKSVVWKDCNFIHFSYSWQISHLRSKNSL